jgi:hypothetical protein
MKIRTIVLTSVVVVAALGRFLPGLPPNFTPISAMVIFAAIRYRSLAAGVLVPLSIVLGTDIVKEILYRNGLTPYWGFYKGMPLIYATYALIALTATLAKVTRSPAAMAGVTLAGSCIFFVFTNFASWLQPEIGYPRTLAGLEACYIAAIPFFRNTLYSDLAFATVLFGVWALAEDAFPVLRPAPSTT